jgi:hypothetical protein
LSPDFQALTFCAFHRNRVDASISPRLSTPSRNAPLAYRKLKQRRELVPAVGRDALDPGYRVAKGHPFGREKRTEQASNYPFQRIFYNKPPYGKDRQRYALYLTVFWSPSMCTSEKTVRNTVNLSGYRRHKLLRDLQIIFFVQ